MYLKVKENSLTVEELRWMGFRAIKNKAQIWVYKALDEIEINLPFPLLGIHSDKELYNSKESSRIFKVFHRRRDRGSK